MCGIVGAIAQRDVAEILLEGLRRLEYRGYDSAGLAVVDAEGHMTMHPPHPYSMRFIHIQQYIIILLLQSDQTTEIGLITVHTENTFGYNNYSIIPGMIGNQQLFQLFVPVMPVSDTLGRR